jgi:DNA-binding MarR family transcriptional regulator
MDQTDRLQAAISGIMRALKVAEGAMLREKGALRLTPSDVQALHYLAAHDGAMSGALAQALGVVPTTATSIADRLVRRGLVRRDRQATNRRAVALGLTEAGRVALSRLHAEERAAAAAMLQALAPEERDGIIDAITRIAAHLNRPR